MYAKVLHQKELGKVHRFGSIVAGRNDRRKVSRSGHCVRESNAGRGAG